MSRRKDTGFPVEVKQIVFARSQGNCEILTTGCLLVASEYHHRRPRGHGGTKRPETNLASNALHVCRRCHALLESRRRWAADNGFLVSQFREPAEVPVWWRCNRNGDSRVWVLLDDQGDMAPSSPLSVVRGAE
jgi:hypothetical protein